MSKKSKVTLEDLLKIKKLEKPSPNFWEHFDKELHQKTLQSLVDSTPFRFSLSSLVLKIKPILAVTSLVILTGLLFTSFDKAPTHQGFSSELNLGAQAASQIDDHFIAYNDSNPHFIQDVIESSNDEHFECVHSRDNLEVNMNNDRIRYVAGSLSQIGFASSAIKSSSFF